MPPQIPTLPRIEQHAQALLDSIDAGELPIDPFEGVVLSEEEWRGFREEMHRARTPHIAPGRRETPRKGRI